MTCTAKLASLVPQHVQAIPPYAPGRAASSVAREFGLQEANLIQLASNENPLGMSPRAKEALIRLGCEAARYPDTDCVALREAIGAQLGVEPSWIVVGNGSCDILEMVARAYLERGRSAIVSEYAFAVYKHAIQMTSANCIEVPAKDLGHDLDALAAAVTDETNVIYLANPNNPTGTYFMADAFVAFMARIPWNVVVVLDEAYAEYLPSDEMLSSVSFAKSYPNLILVRSFSKAYGLAGLRVGFAIGRPELVAPLNKIRTPFNVTTLGQVAAKAALEDTEFVERTRILNQNGMKFVVRELVRAGFPHVPSKGNFVLVEVGDAMAVHGKLMARSVIVRPVASYGLPTWLRISIGLPEENSIMIRALCAVTGKIAQW